MAKSLIKVGIRNVTGRLPDFPNDHYGSPDSYKNGKWFYVEAHARNVIGWWGPIGLGVVHVGDDGRAYLESIFVVDGAREKRLATRIVEIAGRRWPAIYWHGSDASRSFNRKLVRRGIARRRKHLQDVYEFVPKEERALRGRSL